jgi:cellobiose-specific phosphotransferase system component IIC
MTVIRFVGSMVSALLASWLVSGTFAILIAQMFRMQEEFIIVLMMLSVLCLGVLVMLAVAYWLAKRAGTIDGAALGCALAVFTIMGTLAIAGYVNGRSASASVARDMPVFLAIILPMLAAIVTQWWILKRRWLSAHAT